MSEHANAAVAEKTSLDLQDILKILPHRFPFLLIDRITELVRTKRIVALKNVTINEPFKPEGYCCSLSSLTATRSCCCLPVSRRRSSVGR